MVPGALVLNAHAYDVLGPFLSKFGQLLELQTETGLDPREFYNEAEPGTRYFYNVTHLVPCVDLERSERNDLGHIRLEVFDTANVPVEAAVSTDCSSGRASRCNSTSAMIASASAMPATASAETTGSWTAICSRGR